jgi:hypothetical protein
MKRSLAFAAVALALSLPSVKEANAGLFMPTLIHSCTTYSDGSGYCIGTLDGFRNYNGDSSSYAYFKFNVGTWTNRGFTAQWQGVSYSCNASSTVYPDVYNAWPHGDIGMSTWFEVDWDSSKNCKFLMLTASSYTP